MSSLNSIDLTGSIEKNLSGLLHPIGLDFEKQNADSYIIVSRIKEIQKTEPDLKGIRNTTQMLASTSLQFPSTLARPFLPTPRPVERTISGTVKSSDTKEELPGVSVVLKGTARGTTTDVNGRFKLEIPEAEVILVFSYVGYTTQEVAVAASASALEVELKVDDKALEEVVVVDFGQQRKTDVIGSVVSVKPADLKVPSSNLTTALAGRVADVISYQRSGEPGQDNAAFFIRGVTTFGYKLDPLILIDNVEVTTTELARIQPDDIASFSIMKDATATALYGARGANGVILVITKQGVEGPAKISFRMENSISAPTQNVKLADPVTYMKLHNESVQSGSLYL